MPRKLRGPCSKRNKPQKKRKNQISNISDKEFKVLIIKVLTGLERRVDELNECFNKDLENKYKLPELKNN